MVKIRFNEFVFIKVFCLCVIDMVVMFSLLLLNKYCRKRLLDWILYGNGGDRN